MLLILPLFNTGPFFNIDILSTSVFILFFDVNALFFAAGTLFFDANTSSPNIGLFLDINALFFSIPLSAYAPLLTSFFLLSISFIFFYVLQLSFI